ncbi:hypothetical protein GF376_04040 [Candidatus Peregrinibacteria bacterium]|nr:hypothetical protein [Candidatus Peregrinibacteria bacterium]
MDYNKFLEISMISFREEYEVEGRVDEFIDISKALIENNQSPKDYFFSKSREQIKEDIFAFVESDGIVLSPFAIRKVLSANQLSLLEMGANGIENHVLLLRARIKRNAALNMIWTTHMIAT